ncbi:MULTISPECIES: hypothetical protein [unclassified Shewanella]|uniref:hypothetical protein n=1 Tax=unclassified Shewanella TaxID=196818 RepID=UPI001BB8F192|nr:MULTISPECIES: hypothetical protein [unclassified Shewanella]GIU16120.1 hypothetical protein TUM4444_28460 [Shewanella sp. MBTL60-112-B1]GIU33802.1 hypothetical protein TUM4445_21520 [Shewanella sp. MBTL60-112-B2]
MFRHNKVIELGGNQIKFDYHGLSGRLKLISEGNILFEKSLWLPYKRYPIDIFGERYQIKALIFPINKIGVYLNEQPICSDLFPKLKRYSLISFTFTCIKRFAMVFAYALS